MLKHRTPLLVFAILLFIIGMTSLVMMLSGVSWSFLTWIDALGRGFGLIIRILMIMSGVVLLIAGQTDWEKEKEESNKG
jgi:hypothetical protein